MTISLDAVVFDFGGVLVDWQPQNFFLPFLDNDPQKLTLFFKEIDYFNKNDEMDRGLKLADACQSWAETHPHYQHIFEAYRDRWIDTLAGPIAGSVEILKNLDRQSVPLYAITNYNSENLAKTRETYDFFDVFKGIVVSDDERVLKPDPAIYKILLQRYSLTPERLLFIDDRQENVEAAVALGFHGHHFKTPELLLRDLERYKVL